MDSCVQTFLYKPGVPLPDLKPFLNQIVEMRVPSEYLCVSNPAYVGHRLWGCDVYTGDSDVVCMLHHGGYKRLTAEAPDDIAGVSVYLKVLKGRSAYPQATRNALRSRKWMQDHPSSIRIARVDDVIDRLGTPEELEMLALRMPSVQRSRKCKVQSHGQIKFLADILITFNLCNEPCSRYSLTEVCDRGLELSQWTTYRLTQEVLYIESDLYRYELCQEGFNSAVPSSGCSGSKGKTADGERKTKPKNEKKENNSNLAVAVSISNSVGGSTAGVGVSKNINNDNTNNSTTWKTYRFSRVLRPQSLTREEMMTQSVPLPSQRLEILESGLDWTEISFGADCMEVRHRIYPNLLRVQYYPVQSPEGDCAYAVGGDGKSASAIPAGLNKDDRGMWLLLSALEDQADVEMKRDGGTASATNKDKDDTEKREERAKRNAPSPSVSESGRPASNVKARRS